MEYLRRIKVHFHRMLLGLLGGIDVCQYPIQRDRDDTTERMDFFNRLTQDFLLGIRGVGETKFTLGGRDRHNALGLIHHGGGVNFGDPKALFLEDALHRDRATIVELRVVLPRIHLRLIDGKLQVVLFEHAGPARIGRRGLGKRSRRYPHHGRSQHGSKNQSI